MCTSAPAPALWSGKNHCQVKEPQRLFKLRYLGNGGFDLCFLTCPISLGPTRAERSDNNYDHMISIRVKPLLFTGILIWLSYVCTSGCICNFLYIIIICILFFIININIIPQIICFKQGETKEAVRDRPIAENIYGIFILLYRRSSSGRNRIAFRTVRP